jgi:type VI secretion system protein ImpJ
VGRFPEVHWSEGMFLRPQHFQMFSRQLGGMVADVWRRTQPFLWGFSDLEIDKDALETFSFSLRRCEAVLRDGTWLQYPTNLRLHPRDFKEALNASDGRLPVYLAVPLLREAEANTLGPEGVGGPDLRYSVEAVEATDENLGGPARPIEIRKLNGRILLGDESREGYETLPLGLLQRAGYGANAPMLAADFIPPLLNIAVWPELVKLGESVLHRVEAKHRYLRAEVAEGRIVLDTEGTGGWQPVFKLQIVGSFLHVLRQLTGSPGIHPFQLYLELTRLAGELSIFEDDGSDAVGVPLYDHDRLGECFHGLAYILERLLERILSGRFIRVEFRVEGDLLVARLRDEWLAREAVVYLCIESDLSDRDLLTRIRTVKIGTSTDLPLLEQRRLFGLDIDLLKRTPGGLPARENLHYFSIAKEGPYWDGVARSREMAISGGIDPRLRFSLFIIVKPERDDTPGRR